METSRVRNIIVNTLLDVLEHVLKSFQAEKVTRVHLNINKIMMEYSLLPPPKRV